MSTDVFTLRFDRPLEREIVRVVRSQTNRARRVLKAPGDEAVHTARKAVKHARAALRLVCYALPRERYHTLDAGLRACGRRLGPVRDGAVACTLTDVFHASGDLTRTVTRALRGYLDDERSAAWRTLDADGIEGLRSDLDDLRLTPEELAGLGVPALCEGLGRTYARGQRRLASAVEEPSAEALHAWRRHVKYLYYQLRLVAPAWPLVLRPTARAFDALGKALGEDHDLAELERLARRADLSSEAVEAVAAVVEGRRRALQAEVWPLGTRAYAEPPAAFEGRMDVYLRTALAEARREPGLLRGEALPVGPAPAAGAPAVAPLLMDS
jgi:CHAD domain-containing protein